MLGIVVPVYNEGINVKIVYDAIRESGIKYNTDYRLLFVDDGSTDFYTLSVYDSLVDCEVFKEPHKGQHYAIMSGFRHLQNNCDYVCTIDCDMQDPPDILFAMYSKLMSTDADAIRGVRTTRNDTCFKKLTAKLYYKLISIIVKLPAVNSSDFFVVKSDCIHRLDADNLRLSLWIKCNTLDYSYIRNGRISGKTKYNFSKLINTALSGMKYAIYVRRDTREKEKRKNN